MVQLIRPQLEELLLSEFFKSDIKGKYLTACIIAGTDAVNTEKERIEKKYYGEKLEVLYDLVKNTNDLNSFLKIKLKNGEIKRIKITEIMDDISRYEYYLTQKIVENSKIKL